MSQLTQASIDQVSAARTAADALGLYFQLPVPSGSGWQPIALLSSPELDELLEAVRDRLGGCERRVAASVFYQGFAARLISPQLACAAMSGCLPEIPADRLSWRKPADEMIQLALPAGPGLAGPAPALLSQLLRQSFTSHLLPLATAIRTRVKIPSDLLQDNAAAALVSGLRLLDPGGWRPLAQHALADPLLQGSGVLRPAEPGFVRRSCCLYYRTPAGGLCGDCPLA